MSTSDGTSSRNELNQVVAASHQDVYDMQEKLSKLRALSEDDKSENGLLRARIDEQSQLIMILKQRADEANLTAKALERVNADLVNFRDRSNEQIARDAKKYEMLDARFNDLAENHEELIKIKDEYKFRNADLMRENAKLREENAKQFSKSILERDEKISVLEGKLSGLREQYNNMDSNLKTTTESLETLQQKYTTEVKTLQTKIQETEERLKGAMARLLQSEQNQEKLEQDSSGKYDQLKKEKDELLDLAMSRGKLIQEKQSENKKLQTKIDQMEKAVKDMQEKFERDSAAVNANIQVKRLQKELSDAKEARDNVIRDHEAFKKYSASMLQKEKDLNQKLRQLWG